MGAPPGFSDFYELELQINYNNANQAYLQGYVPGTYQPPQEQQAGWTERYYLYLTAQPNGTNLPIQNAYTLVQARASLLGLNFYIKKAICHQGSVFKSSWPMPNSARLALFDGAGTTTAGLTTQWCSSPEETMLLRCEAGSLRRWEYQIRGIKDYMSDDTMSYFPATSYADSTTQPQTSPFDAAQPAIPPASFSGGTPATITVTNTSGAISSPVIVTGGNYPGVVNGSYYAYINSTVSQTQQAFATITIAGGAVTAVSIYAGLQGTGYQGTNATIPLSNDPYGAPNYQAPSVYWSNFLSCLISYTGSGQIQRIASKLYTAPVPGFPSKLSPAIVNAMVKANRAMVQRIGNRQTGQIRLTKKARVKRGI